MIQNTLGILFILVLMTGLLDVAGPVMADERPQDPLGDRFAIVGRLLNDSSAARQVEESDVEQARELRAMALERYAAAHEAHESGDTDVAESGLAEAMRLMYAALSATQQGGVVTEKIDRDFRDRRASVEALLAAHQRISEEKDRQREHDLLGQEIAAALDSAEEFLRTGETGRARRHLDAAYDMVKLAVRQLRQGDTLVRELRFETKEDEYLYELDRNNSHKMLVVVLLEERLKDERIRNRVTPLISTAGDLREVGESQAADGRFAEAVETLERSTRELVRAIRAAGVYIPG